jgi:hypothetical protein
MWQQLASIRISIGGTVPIPLWLGNSQHTNSIGFTLTAIGMAHQVQPEAAADAS